MHTIDTMKNIMRLRVHIAPVGFEIDRIIVPATKMRADKVWLIGHNNLSHDKARAFLEKIKKKLEKKNIEVKEITADRYRLFDIVKIGPILWADNLKSGLGVMLDDCLAGCVTFSIITFYFIII